jgi:DNA-binding PadR family transcriptional regulator
MSMHPPFMMRGFLSFLVLWMLRKEPMTGMEIAKEMEKRKGHRPSPGTIYPVLKVMKKRGLLEMDEEKRYSLTEKGREELDRGLDRFFGTFFDIDEMREHCRCDHKGPCHHHHHGHHEG